MSTRADGYGVVQSNYGNFVTAAKLADSVLDMPRTVFVVGNESNLHQR